MDQRKAGRDLVGHSRIPKLVEMMTRQLLLTLCAILLWSPVVHSTGTVHHRIAAQIEPEAGRLEVEDRITLPPGNRQWTFLLHAGLDVEVIGGGAKLTPAGGDFHLKRWRLDLGEPAPVTLRYRGRIRHGLQEIRQSMGRTRQWSLGLIAADGAFLSGQSGWYPTSAAGSAEELVTFELTISLPRGWQAVSQGAGPHLRESADGVQVTWEATHPQDEIHLVAAPFHHYRRATPVADAQVYLRSPDRRLANRYLEATAEYLSLYDRLIGPYPYAKFALVENFWETGYGMPSFTLLGPRVLRLPFILRTSYPHEILHNWWGNGVYVDYTQGNWSEGLTSYLADHLLRAQRGEDRAYRRDTLKAYRDYVDRARDFPLRAFRGRHSSATQAVGYGKGMMFMHMLRRELGDAAFLAGLQRFYAENRFRVAGFADLRAALESESGRDLRQTFRHWTERAGAPHLELADVQLGEGADAYRITGTLKQTQDAAPFPLMVLLVVHTATHGVETTAVRLDGREAAFDLAPSARPLRIAADPYFDLFRDLVAGEAPITLSNLFGAERGLIVLPSSAPSELAAAYRRLAKAWARDQDGWQIRSDAALGQLPADRPVWLLGWENRLLGRFGEHTGDFGLDLSDRQVRLPGGESAAAREGLVLTRTQGSRPLGWLATATPQSVDALARKVPHYGKYSYLVFAHGSDENRLKGQWPIGATNLMVWFGEDRPKLPLPARPPLTAAMER